MAATIPHIRSEIAGDAGAIRDVERAAFAASPRHTAGTEPIEPRIVDSLRAAGALALSLIAEFDLQIIGHVAFSPVLVAGRACGYYGLGPLAVRPDRQRQGIGAALVTEGVERLRAMGAAGVVLVGEPEYYGRFGFRQEPRLRFDGVPAEYFLVLPLNTPPPTGAVTYHESFFESGTGAA